MTDDWAVVFNATFSAPASTVQAGVWAEVFGDEYMPSLDTFSYVSRTELRRVVEELRVTAGQRIADVGCGRGGPSLWVCGQTGADVIGVDIAESAVRCGQDRAAALGLTPRATFKTGTFERLPLLTESIDGVMSIDALLFTPDKAKALREFARVLRPGARLVLTTWDYSRQPPNRPPQVEDHRPLLDDVGFAVESYEETVEWQRRQYETTDRLLELLDEYAAELDEDPARLRGELQAMRATMDCMRQRVLVVAERRG